MGPIGELSTPIVAKRRRTSVLHALFLRLTAIGISLTVTLLLLEGVARLIPLWPDPISDVDSELGWSHVPGAKGWWVNIATPLEFRTYVQISSQGLRDREFELEKAAGVTRILLLGDSMVDGLEVPLENTFAKQLERLFRESGRNVEVINGGHYGYGTDQELLAYRLRGHKYQPDVVVLCFTTNDIEDNLATNSLASKPFFVLAPDAALQLENFPVDTSAEQDSSKASLFKRTKEMLYAHSKLYRFAGYQIKRQLAELGDPLAQSGSNEAANPESSSSGLFQEITSDYHERGWTLTQALILELEKEVESRGSKFVVAIMPVTLQFTPFAEAQGMNVIKWNRRVMQLCSEVDLQCIDLYPIFRSLIAQDQSTRLFYPQDGHPNSEGHWHIAEALYGYLTTHISMLGNVQ